MAPPKHSEPRDTVKSKGRKVQEKGIEALPPLTELKKLNARQLKSLCTARGLPTRGKKTTLIERLQRHGEGAKLEL